MKTFTLISQSVSEPWWRAKQSLGRWIPMAPSQVVLGRGDDREDIVNLFLLRLGVRDHLVPDRPVPKVLTFNHAMLPVCLACSVPDLSPTRLKVISKLLHEATFLITCHLEWWAGPHRPSSVEVTCVSGWSSATDALDNMVASGLVKDRKHFNLLSSIVLQVDGIDTHFLVELQWPNNLCWPPCAGVWLASTSFTVDWLRGLNGLLTRSCQLEMPGEVRIRRVAQVLVYSSQCFSQSGWHMPRQGNACDTTLVLRGPITLITTSSVVTILYGVGRPSVALIVFAGKVPEVLPEFDVSSQHSLAELLGVDSGWFGILALRGCMFMASRACPPKLV